MYVRDNQVGVPHLFLFLYHIGFTIYTYEANTASDSLTQSRINYNLDQMSVAAQRQGSAQKANNTSPEIDAWISAADPSGNIPARGYYDYAATCKHWSGIKFHTMELAIRIQGTQINGSSQDDLGHAQLQGSFNPAENSVSLIKQYDVPIGNSYIRWEYVGYITSCGIVGEWRYPGDPPEKAHWRGKFGIWLQRDEDAKGAEFDMQMRLLSDKGQILSRSMTGLQ